MAFDFGQAIGGLVGNLLGQALGGSFGSSGGTISNEQIADTINGHPVNKTISSYMYKLKFEFVPNNSSQSVEITNECIRAVVIDHNYDQHSMPIIYVMARIEKKLLDAMIEGQDNSVIIFTCSKYDNNTQNKAETNCFKKKCIYFLPDNVNKMDKVDYNEKTNPEMAGNTYAETAIGLMVLEHINNNKKSCGAVVKNSDYYKYVKKITAHLGGLIMEKFHHTNPFSQIIVPPKITDSVNKTLQVLNNQRVFYDTPYRFYQDFNHSYLISSSGKEFPRPDEKYHSIIISIYDVDDVATNHEGVVTGSDIGAYEVYVNYVSVQCFDNTVANKSKTRFRAASFEGGVSDVPLSNQTQLLKQKKDIMRMNNDNTIMAANIRASEDRKNFLVFFSKDDLDTDIFSINKKISINNIQRYREYNGTYLLFRKREVYTREDQSFKMTSFINLKRIDA